MLQFETLLRKIRERDQEEALVWRGRSYSFRDIDENRLNWLKWVEIKGVKSGQVVGLQADYSPQAISLFLALLSNRNIVALISPYTTNEEILLADSQTEFLFRLEKSGSWEWEKRASKADHPLLTVLKGFKFGGLYRVVIRFYRQAKSRFTRSRKIPDKIYHRQ